MFPVSVLSMLKLANASSPTMSRWNDKLTMDGGEYAPNKLRAYMFADRKSQSPDNAPSGVRQDMFVTFITCERYSRGSL